MHTDQKLIEGCLKGKRFAQKMLYDRYAMRMLGVCMRYIKKQDEAEDVLQEGFIKVFQKLDTFRNTGTLEGWIRRIMVNSALNQIRHKVKLEIDRDIDTIHAIADEDMDEDTFDYNISSEELYGMIQSLPNGYKTVFSLYAVDEYNHKEIGEMLGISEGTSKSQLSRARILLKKMVEELFRQKTNVTVDV
jgi:RNA polymerase sigma factor (sigma-70 family)